MSQDVDTPTATPADALTHAPADDPMDALTDVPTEDPADTPTDEPTAVPADDPEVMRRRLIFLAAGAVLAVLLAVLALILAGSTFLTGEGPYEPEAADGFIADGTSVSLDDDVPAITRLDPALRDAVSQAQADAADDGLTFEITGGWRSAEYQQWEFDEAVELYGSEEAARAQVATPADSAHVAGTAINVGPSDVQFWLLQFGAKYGLCQTSTSERSQIELATEPGGVCPTPASAPISAAG